MSARTVDWAALRTLAGADQPGLDSARTGLRERKRRRTRQQLTDTATEMFLERGFDAVSIAEIAEACGVSPKTVYNYFPTKESLILDHPATTLVVLRGALADPGTRPVAAALGVLARELDALSAWFDAQPDRAEAIRRYQRFGTLVQTTPALRAYQREMADQLVDAAAEVLANRAGVDPADPEPVIAATALLALWPIQFASLGKHLDPRRSTAETHAAVTADVRRAATLLVTGLDALVSRQR
jgi:AcrR family transcriptional regulator